MSIQSTIDLLERSLTTLPSPILGVTFQVSPEAMRGWLAERGLPTARQSASLRLAAGVVVHVMAKSSEDA